MKLNKLEILEKILTPLHELGTVKKIKMPFYVRQDAWEIAPRDKEDCNRIGFRILTFKEIDCVSTKNYISVEEFYEKYNS